MGFIQGTTIGAIKEDTRSVDERSHVSGVGLRLQA